jgi:hypothetical protein
MTSTQDIRPELGRRVELPVVGVVHIPPTHRLVYFAGLGALAVFGVIDWPVAVVVGAGHLLADQHWSRVAAGLGEALEEA